MSTRTEKTKASLILKYGSYEAYKLHLKEISSRPRPNGGKGGFYQDRELARIAGIAGGSVGKKKPKLL